MKYLLLGLSLVLAVAGQFLLKSGILTGSLSPSINSVIKTLFSPLVFLGFVAYGLSSLIWLFVLQRFPLSVAYPTLALAYVAIVLLGAVFLKEPITIGKLAGVAFIMLGVFLLFK